MKRKLFRTTYFPATLAAALMVAGTANAQMGFTDVSDAAGFMHSGETYGASWGDFNGDGYPDIFENNHRDWPALYRNNGDGTFTDVILSADGSGIWKWPPKKKDTHGASFADFDGDGDKDLYVTTGGAYDGALLVNRNNILFDESIDAHLFQDVEGRLPVWFDFDNNGRLDMAFMIRSASRVYVQSERDPIWYGNVTTASGLDCDSMDFGQLSDFTGDGVMELICGNGTYPRKIYDLTTYPFTDITTIMPFVSRGTDAAIADFDGDLDPDVFVIAGRRIPNGVGLTSSTSLEAGIGASGGMEAGFGFQTDGMITVDRHIESQLDDVSKVFIGAGGVNPTTVPFTLDPADPTTHGIHPHDPETNGGVWVGYDPGLGQWDVLVSGPSDLSTGSYFSVSSTSEITDTTLTNLIPGDYPERPYFLRNDGGTFIEDGTARGLDEAVQCVSVTAGDFDNDMDVDVYVVCRTGVQNIPNRLYENLGDGTFALVASPHGAEGVEGFHLADKAGLGDSAVVADYDLDGCLDIFVSNGLSLQPTRHDSGPDQLFNNNCPSSNHWLELDLRGFGIGASNPEGIGATVYVTAGGKTQLREQNGGYHRWSQNHSRLHFGLAANALVEEIRVEWPSGVIDVHTNVAANQLYEIREGEPDLYPVTLGGGAFPAPVPGDECGEPAFNAGSHAALFLWKDCDTGVWSVRATAGWSTESTPYKGSVISDQPFVSVTPYLMEGSDLLDNSVSGQILYEMRMTSGGRDGFEFELAPGASACFEIGEPLDAQFLLGAGSLPAERPLDLNSLQGCQVAPEIRIEDLVVDESAGTASFIVNLSAASGSDVLVDYSTADGSATAPADYTSTSGTLVLLQGEISGQIDVTIVDDSLGEGSEFFTLDLTNAFNAIVIDSQGIGTITDNEIYACGEPSIDAATETGLFLWQDCPSDVWHMRVTAGGGPKITYEGRVDATQPFPSAPVGFSLEGSDSLDSSNPLAVLYELKVSGAGRDGFAFETPASGQTCFAVTSPLDAQVYLGEEKDSVGTSLDLATLGDCSPTLSVEDVTVNENDGIARFTLTLSAASSQEVRVDYATSDGTATSPDDYTAVSDTLILTPGETSAHVDVPIVDDGLSEDTETFSLILSNPVAAILTDGSATGTITDNEPYACGEPSIDSATETGVFLWRDCPTDAWHMRVTAGGGPKITYEGQVLATQPFPSTPVAYSHEGADWMDSSDPLAILFGLKVSGTGQDGFDFRTPTTGQTCFELTAPANAQVYVGVGKDLVGGSVDLATLGACGP